MKSAFDRLRWSLAAACMVLLVASPLAAQKLTGLLNTSSSATAAAGVDPLDRATPRTAIYAFLEACHRGKYARASEYLDLSHLPKDQRQINGAEYARRLGLLLDRDADFEVERLDNTPDGRTDDDLAADLDVLNVFEMGGRTVTFYLQRQQSGGVPCWVVSADSVSRIPELEPLTEGPAFEKRLPEPLVRIKLIGTPLWAWIALVLLAVVISAVSKLLSKLALAIVKPIARRYLQPVHTYRVESFTEPIRLLVSVGVFRACMEFVATSALLRDYILGVITLLVIFGAAAVIMRVVDLISDQITSRLDPRERALSHSVLPLGVRFVKICIFCIAVLVMLDQWGLHITTILAGVGVGGLAVALAAQKTIENLFGGISLITDRPVLVGDVCQFGGQTGTVEDIGLRSTRIRTPERTLVTIPNAQFSTMTLENLSRREKILFRTSLQVRRGTPVDRLQAFMEAVKQFLCDEPRVDATEVPLRFTRIAPEAFVIEVFSYVLTNENNQFLKVQSELLVKILQLAEDNGVQLAVPFQESLQVTAQ